MTQKDEKYDYLESEIKKLKNTIKDLKTNRGGMLSSADFLNLVILENLEEEKKKFWKRDWDKVNKRIIISPFSPEKLTPFSYDLSVGNEVYSCRDERVYSISSDKLYLMKCKDTIVIKTKEFIALPPNYSATVWPRFRMPVEAIFQSMVKIDPTWFGELGVAVTNLSNGEYPIKYDDRFATLVLYELKTPTGMNLWRKEDIPEKKDELPTNIHETELRNKLEQNGLKKFCTIHNRSIIINNYPNEDDFNQILKLFDNQDCAKEWKDFIKKCISNKHTVMDSLGLTNLNLVKPVNPKVQKLQTEELRKDYSMSQIERTAIEYGKPFNLLVGVHDRILESIDEEALPRIKAQVEASLFPKIIPLTLTVLGFLSIIIAISAFVMEKFRVGGLVSDVDWSDTAFGTLIFVCIVLIASFLIFTFKNSPESRAISKLKTEVNNLKERLSNNSNVSR